MNSGSKILLEHDPITLIGRLSVYLKSLIVIGSFFYTPLFVLYASRLKRYTKALAYSILGILLAAPVSRSKWVQKSWILLQLAKYFDIKVVGKNIPMEAEQTIYAMAPHGIVPYSLGMTAFGKLNELLSNLRIVTATATRLVPFFTHTLRFGGSIDASASIVDSYLYKGDSLGITPGGIAEMFVGHPQPGFKADHEYAVMNSRKGFVRLALKHMTSIRPMFVFGASKLYKRIVLPQWVEWISNKLRLSIVLFYGKWGTPIPFDQPLLYALGENIYTSHYFTKGWYESQSLTGNLGTTSTIPTELVDFVHNTVKKGLVQTFNENKQGYGWGHKTLTIV